MSTNIVTVHVASNCNVIIQEDLYSYINGSVMWDMSAIAVYMETANSYKSA